MPLSNVFTPKIFFRFFPKPWWIFILAAILLKFISPDDLDVASSLIINVSCTFLFLKLTTIIHECGHLAAAKLVGGIPRRMVLGRGHEVYRTEVSGVKIIFNSIPVGGLAFAIFNDDRNIRWKHAAYIVGGVLANLLVAAVFYFLFNFQPRYLSGRYGVDLASALILVNALAVLNLLPFYSSTYGMKIPTDGLFLLQLPFRPKKYYKDIELKNRFLDAYEYMENREYDKAYEIYTQYLSKFPDEPLPIINMSVIHLRNGEIDNAFTLLEPLLKKVESKELRNYKGYVYNNLAWIYLLKNDIDQAYHYADLTIKVMPSNPHAWGAYGALLIEKGELLTGMQWLFKNMDLEHVNSTTLIASMFLMVAFHLRGDLKNRDLHMNHVKRNIDKLEPDERLVFDRNLDKIGMKVVEDLS